MMSSAAWSALCLIALPHRARLAVWRHPVGLPHIVVVSCEWSTGSVLHCSRLSTRLARHDGVACPHVIQTIMALVSGALETHKHALETCEPS
jgi:hypothetical protein